MVSFFLFSSFVVDLENGGRKGLGDVETVPVIRREGVHSIKRKGGRKRRGKKGEKENYGEIDYMEKEHGIPSRWETKRSEARNNYKIKHD